MYHTTHVTKLVDLLDAGFCHAMISVDIAAVSYCMPSAPGLHFEHTLRFQCERYNALLAPFAGLMWYSKGAHNVCDCLRCFVLSSYRKLAMKWHPDKNKDNTVSYCRKPDT